MVLPRRVKIFFCNLRYLYVLVCCANITWPMQCMSGEDPAEVGSIVVVGALTRCALLHSECDFKVTKLNVQHSLIQELMLHEFEHSAEVIKNIYCTKKMKTQWIKEHKWLKKFPSYNKNLDNQTRSSGSKLVDFEVMLQAREANALVCTRFGFFV